MASSVPEAPEFGGAPTAPSATRVPRPSGGPRPGARLVAAGLGLAAVFAAPLVYLASKNVALGTEFLDVLRAEHIGDPLRRSLALGVSVAFTTVLFGTTLAWLCTRTDLPGRRVWRLLVPLPLVIPSFVGALSLIAAFAPGGLADRVASPLGVALPRVEGFWSVVVVLTLLTYPYVYLPVSARLSLLPPSLEESARALGRTPWEVFRTVVVPQISGAIWAGALLVFLYVLSEFGAVQLLHYDTLTRAIYSARLFDRRASLALSLVLGTIAVTVVVAERALARRRLVTEATTDVSQAFHAPLGVWKYPALAFVGSVVTLALVAPVTVLLHWTLRGALAGVDLHADRLPSAAFASAWLGVVAAGAAIVAVLPIAYLTARHRTRAGDAANALVVSGFALPGLVVGLTAIAAVLQTPILGGLYQTYVLMVVAYVVHFGSQALRSAQVAVGGVPRRIDDAARSLGANRSRRLLTVDLPLMRRGLAAGYGLVLLSTLKELPATLVLRPPGVETLATRVWGASEDGFYAEAGLLALVLLVLSGLLTWVLTVRPLERAA